MTRLGSLYACVLHCHGMKFDIVIIVYGNNVCSGISIYIRQKRCVRYLDHQDMVYPVYPVRESVTYTAISIFFHFVLYRLLRYKIIALQSNIQQEYLVT